MTPDLRPSKTGHWPRRLTDVPLGQPLLAGKDVVVGWVSLPSEGTWQPQDLLWVPDGLKALDLAGEVVDVQTWPGFDGVAWVTSQLKLRERYLDAIRRKVLDGGFTLTAAIAKALGVPYDDGAMLEDRRHDQTTTPSMRELRAIRDDFFESVGALN